MGWGRGRGRNLNRVNSCMASETRGISGEGISGDVVSEIDLSHIGSNNPPRTQRYIWLEPGAKLPHYLADRRCSAACRAFRSRNRDNVPLFNNDCGDRRDGPAGNAGKLKYVPPLDLNIPPTSDIVSTEK
jgi:hypothetical protein